MALGNAAGSAVLLCTAWIAGTTQRSYAQDTGIVPPSETEIPLAQNQNQTAAQIATLATVHGVVVNSVTGEPLPRALVRLDGGEAVGALTDGEGRYEIAGVPTGPQLFEVLKPGYLDEQAEAEAQSQTNSIREFSHTVTAIVGAEMPDVVFKMEPANSIRGKVQLSTGETAQGIDITLLKQTIELGRTTWQVAASAKTNADGVYRFGGLADGVYAIYNAPAMESDTIACLVEPGRGRNMQRSGYASLFYPEAHDLAGAAKIVLHGGTQTEANLSLTLEPFYAVTAATSEKAADAESPGPIAVQYSATVTDSQGHQLPYTTLYDQATHTVQAYLPDGSYMFVVNGGRLGMRGFANGVRSTTRIGNPPDNEHTAGEVEFSVSGHAVTGLRVPLAPVRLGSVQVNTIRSDAAAAAQTPGPAGAHGVSIMLSKTGAGVGDGMMTTFATGTLEGQIETMFAEPGTYWAHANLSGLCVSSLTVGGTNLAREPLTVGLAGLGAPLTLNVRDDCARLTLTLPATAAGMGVGEEQSYTVYAVPDLDSAEDVVPQTLRPSTGGKIALQGLTPGNYHLYVFDKPVALAYRERAAIDALPQSGQTVELSPGSAVNLVLEVPNHE